MAERLTLSIDTQVVTLVATSSTTGTPYAAGTVGVVISSSNEPEPRYTIRATDGAEAVLQRAELRIRKHYQRDGWENLDMGIDLQQYVIYRCVVGSRAYGLDDESSDTDYDLRGVHVLPLKEIVGLPARRDTIEVAEIRDGLELDLVTHAVEKFFRLLLKRNGYVLEQLCSPLVLATTPAHAELLALVPQLLTRNHAHHYMGFATTQWGLFAKETPQRVKPLLYVFRVLLTGIHLMQTGQLEANLVTLNEVFRLPYIPELVTRKLAGPEHGTLEESDLAFYEAEYQRLLAALETAMAQSALPEAPPGATALNDLLIRIRLGSEQA